MNGPLARSPYLIITALSSIFLYLLIARCHITKPRTFQCFSSTTIISLFVVYGVIEPSYQLFFTRLQIKWWEMGNKLILNGMRHRAVFYCVSRKKMRVICKGGFYINRKGLNRPTFIKTWFSIFKIWTNIVYWIPDQTGRKNLNYVALSYTTLCLNKI